MHPRDTDTADVLTCGLQELPLTDCVEAQLKL